MTNWETEDLRDRMHNDFMNSYDLLFTKSYRDNAFSEHVQSDLNELSSKLAQSDIYAAAILLDEQSKILVQSDVSNISFKRRTANETDLNRLKNCIRDAQKSVNNGQFPKEHKEGGMSSVGPDGYTQGWTLSDDKGNRRYLFINAKFFEEEIAMKKMIPRYIQTFIMMGVICFFLCLMISRIIARNEVSHDPDNVIGTVTNES